MKRKLFKFLRQLALMLLVIWTVVSLVTLLIELVGDPVSSILGENVTPAQAANFRHKHCLDRPAFFFSVGGSKGIVWNGTDNRYFDYWNGLLHGDLGTSFRTDRPVLDMI